MAAFKIKNFLPRTLFGRSLLILVVPVVLVQITASVVFFDRHWIKVTSRLAYAVAGEIGVIVDAYERAAVRDDNDILYNEPSLLAVEKHLDLSVLFRSDEVLPSRQHNSIVFEVWEIAVADRLEHELEKQIQQDFVLDMDFANKAITVYVQLDNGVLIVELPQRRLFSSSGYIFLLWLFGVSLLLLLISVVFMRNQIRPIRKLAVAAERFGKGHDVKYTKPEGASEVRQAAQAFIDMRQRINRQVQQRTDMLAGVSHDLRTPLTRLKLELELIGDSEDVRAMKDDVHEMERMVDGYLDFIRGEGLEDSETITLLPVIEKLSARIERQGVPVNREIDPSIVLRARPIAFERAVNNLLNNARRYAQNIWFKAVIDADGWVEIIIEDDGPGVEDAMLGEILKPFKRADQSRNSETGGVGLGLSITQDIILSHGGEMSLGRSNTHGGLSVHIKLPL